MLQCWVVTDGTIGMENQCLGLAEAMGLAPTIKRISLRTPWRWFAPYLRMDLRHALSGRGDGLTPPWPDLAIAAGRRSVPAALAVKRRSRGRSFVVQIKDPRIDPRHFDLVVVPRHDSARGDNVVVTTGALHRASPQRLATDAARHADRLAHLPHPRVAVMIGGRNADFRLTRSLTARIAEQLAGLCRRYGAGLMVTPSRRTGARNVATLRDRLQALPAEIWDGTGENPYFAYLALADAVIVTGDSVNMVSEAASTGKPVYVIQLEGRSAKFGAFHDELEATGITRPFAGRLETWRYRPLDDTAAVAAEIAARLRARGWDDEGSALPTPPAGLPALSGAPAR